MDIIIIILLILGMFCLRKGNSVYTWSFTTNLIVLILFILYYIER